MVRCEVCGKVMKEVDFNEFHCSHCGINYKLPIWKARSLHKVKASWFERHLEQFTYMLPWIIVFVVICFLVYVISCGQVMVVSV